MKRIHIIILITIFLTIGLVTTFLYVRAMFPTENSRSNTPNSPELNASATIIPEHTATIPKESVATSPADEQMQKPITTPVSDTTNHSSSYTFTVLADADSYEELSGHNAILEHMLALSAKQKPAFTIFTGDLLTLPDPNISRVQNLKKILDRDHAQYYIAFGKHDVECGQKCVDVWQSVFFDNKKSTRNDNILYHSFDHENTHFILLSSDYPMKHGVDDAQLTWLEKDLSTTEKKQIIVISHVPPVNFYKESTEECHDMTCDEPRRMRLEKLLTKYGVDLVLSGHEHTFDHKTVNGVDYMISGNIGNGKRYKDTTWENSILSITVTNKNIIVTSLNENGGVIRKITISL